MTALHIMSYHTAGMRRQRLSGLIKPQLDALLVQFVELRVNLTHGLH